MRATASEKELTSCAALILTIWSVIQCSTNILDIVRCLTNDFNVEHV